MNVPHEIRKRPFSFVFSWGVLHHTADPDQAFREVARVLRIGGQALIMVYNRESLRYYIRGWQWLLLRGKIISGENLETVQRHFTDGYYQRHYGKSELRTALQKAGLHVTRLHVTHMGKKMLPLMPRMLDEYAKAKAGWLLVAECERTKD